MSFGDYWKYATAFVFELGKSARWQRNKKQTTIFDYCTVLSAKTCSDEEQATLRYSFLKKKVLSRYLAMLKNSWA